MSISIIFILLHFCRSLGLLVPTTRMKIQAGSASPWQKRAQTFPFKITKVRKIIFTTIAYRGANPLQTISPPL